MAATVPSAAAQTLFTDGTNPSELHYICSINHLSSIFKDGILSHHRVEKLTIKDFSNSDVQNIRAQKTPDNKKREDKGKRELNLHRYVNLYINAHNAMMYNIVIDNNKDVDDPRNEICVLRIDPSILNREEVIIAKSNASRKETKFRAATACKFGKLSTGILKSKISLTSKYNPSVTHETKGLPSQDMWKATRQAEVLIPYKVHPSYVKGVYVYSEIAMNAIKNSLTSPAPINLYPSLFFSKNSFQNGSYYLEQREIPPMSNSDYPYLDQSLPTSDDDSSFGEL